jgi:hypothetical protein
MPKILLTVFIASRVSALADKDRRGEMDPTSKLLNYGSVAVGILVGVGTGWYVFVLGIEHVLMFQTGLCIPSHNRRSRSCPNSQERLMKPLPPPYGTQSRARHYCETSHQSQKTMNLYLLPQMDGNSASRVSMGVRYRDDHIQLSTIIHIRVVRVTVNLTGHE